MQKLLEHTIIADRYGGMYSKGKYTAWNLPFTQVPREIDGDDMECATFWGKFMQGPFFSFKKRVHVGFGDTPQSALDDLISKI